MALKNKTALLVDDDPDFRNLAKTILETQGMLVSECSSITEAKQFLETEIPNIILLDMELQKEHGVAFLKERFDNSVWKKIPVIVCSAQNLSSVVKAAIRFGADDYLLKPIKQTWLIQRVRKNLMKEHHLAHFFDEGEEVDVVTKIQAISISETNFVGRSSIGFDQGAYVTAFIPQGNTESIETNFKSEERSHYSSHGPFDTIFLNVAITQAEKERVKILKTIWRF